MARVFFAWELGGDLGHARRVLEVARGVRALGHETAFAFLDLAPLGALAGQPLEWFAAPWLTPPREPTRSPLSASGILLNRGFGDAQGVAGALRAWRHLFTLWNPDLLVADYAPGAQLAARAAGLRHVAIGSGFSMPPPRDPMPALRSWIAMEESALRRADAALLAGVREAFERIDAHAAAPALASDIFRAEAQLLCTWPEVDPYGPREGADYVGPQDDPADGAPEGWRTSRRPRVVAYLKPRDARFTKLLAALALLAGEAIVAAPGLAEAQAQALCKSNLRVHARPLALAPLLAQADFCLCHSGPGMVAHALGAGVPLALLPQQVEQFLVGRRVVAAGCGVMIAPDAPEPDLEGWLAEAFSRQELRAAAAASPARGRRPESAAARIAARLAG